MSSKGNNNNATHSKDDKVDSYCRTTTTTTTRLPTAVCRLFSAAQTFNLLGHHIRYLCYSCSFLSAFGCRLSLSASASACATRCSATFLCAFEAFVLPLGMLYQRPQTTAATSLFACMQVAKFTKAQTHTHTYKHTDTDLRTYRASQVV